MAGLTNEARAKALELAKSKGYIDSWEVYGKQVSQHDADYKPFGAAGGKGCANCQFFVSPDSCLVVSGDISPSGMSRFYEPKAVYVPEPIPVTIVKESTNANANTSSIPPVSVAPSKSLWQKAVNFFKESSDPVQGGMFRVFKSGEQWRVFAVYSNAFKDKHGEILSTVAHKEYVEWVTKSGHYPELHLWHAGPASKWGQIDFVDFVDGFAFASGVVDKDKEHIAEALSHKELASSHGFLGLQTDDTFGLYRTFEISPLPVGAEGNAWTGFNLSAQENLMAGFAANKKAFLKEVAGISDDVITSWEQTFKDSTDKLKAAGFIWKEDEVAAAAPAVTAPDPKAAVTAEQITVLVKTFSDTQAATIKALGDLADSVAAVTKELGVVKIAAEKQQAALVEAALSSPAAAAIAARAFSPAGASSTVVTTREGGEAPPLNSDGNWFDAMIAGATQHVTGTPAPAGGGTPAPTIPILPNGVAS